MRVILGWVALAVLLGACSGKAPPESTTSTPAVASPGVPPACLAYSQGVEATALAFQLLLAMGARDTALTDSLSRRVLAAGTALQDNTAAGGRLSNVASQLTLGAGYAQQGETAKATESFQAASAGMEQARQELAAGGVSCR